MNAFIFRRRFFALVFASVLTGWGLFAFLLCLQGEPLKTAWIPLRSVRIARRVDAKLPQVIAWAAAIRAQTENPLEQAAIAQRLVAEKVVYTASSLIAGVERIPTAAEVLEQRRGNCEAQTIVLASLWKALGLSCRVQSRSDHCWAVLCFDGLKDFNSLPN